MCGLQLEVSFRWCTITMHSFLSPSLPPFYVSPILFRDFSLSLSLWFFSPLSFSLYIWFLSSMTSSCTIFYPSHFHLIRGVFTTFLSQRHQCLACLNVHLVERLWEESMEVRERERETESEWERALTEKRTKKSSRVYLLTLPLFLSPSFPQSCIPREEIHFDPVQYVSHSPCYVTSLSYTE